MAFDIGPASDEVSGIVMDAARMMEMLPETDQSFAYEFIKKLVKAWAMSLS